MRQVLLRINIADPWSLEPIEGVFGIGSGYLLIWGLLIWLILACWEYRTTKRFSPASLILPSIAIAVVSYLAIETPAKLAETGLPIFGYGMMVFLGFLFAGWFALRRAPLAGIDPKHIWDLVTWVFIAGVGGARLFYLVQYRDRVYAKAEDFGDFFFQSINLTDGGLVLLGGVLAVTVAVILFCRIRKIFPLLMGDILFPSFFIGLGFGRIGCLLNGCCFGDRCWLPWAIQFPHPSTAWNVLMTRGYIPPDATLTYGLHPTQIYSSLAAFLLAALTASYFRRRPFDGSVMVLGMLLYAITRFLIEFLRGDEFGQFGTMFTISQWISGAVFLAGLILWGALVVSHRKQTPAR